MGFHPDLVVIKGDNNEPSVARSSTMTGDVSKELGTNAPLLGNLIKSLDAMGFTIGSGDQVNDSGTMYYWTAFQAAPGFMKVDTYVGDENEGPQPQETSVQQGYLEESNVMVTEEMIRMVEALRNFESYVKVLQTFDEVNAEVINEVGKL